MKKAISNKRFRRTTEEMELGLSISKAKVKRASEQKKENDQ